MTAEMPNIVELQRQWQRQQPSRAGRHWHLRVPMSYRQNLLASVPDPIMAEAGLDRFIPMAPMQLKKVTDG